MASVLAITGMVATRTSLKRPLNPVGEIYKPFVTGPNPIPIPPRRIGTIDKQQRNRKERKELARRLRSEDPGQKVVHPHAAGVDVGNSAHYVAVRPDRDS
jgi:hypothetical protein